MGDRWHTQNTQINKVTGENEKCVFYFMEKTERTFRPSQYLGGPTYCLSKCLSVFEQVTIPVLKHNLSPSAKHLWPVKFSVWMMQLHYKTAHLNIKQLAQGLEHRKPTQINRFYYFSYCEPRREGQNPI